VVGAGDGDMPGGAASGGDGDSDFARDGGGGGGGGGDGDVAGNGDGDVTGDGDGDVAGDGDGDVAGDGDGDGDGGSRKALTIQGSQVPSAQSDFPLLVRITDAELQASADPSGLDIHFADLDGTTPLPFERESYDSATGTLVAWVKLNLTGADQVVYLYYGDGETSEKATPAGVWSNAYQYVWHLNTDPSGSNVDGTGHGGDATGVNMEPGDLVGAVIGNGVTFDGSNERLTYTNGLTGSGPSTLSAWVDQSTDGDNNCIISFGTPGSNQVRYLFSTHDSTSTIRVGFNPNSVNTDDGIEGMGWKHVTWVWSAGNTEVFVDGASAYGPVAHPDANTSGTGGRIGANVLDNVFLDGTLDEVRVSTAARSADWIATEYSNQRVAATFITVGAEESP